MKNREKFASELIEFRSVALDIRDNKIKGCSGLNSCLHCAFNEPSCNLGFCEIKYKSWLDKEYIEPCNFEHDEVIEVSSNELDWFKRHFKEKVNNKFRCYNDGKSSLSIDYENEYTTWTYARKLQK